MFTQCLQSESCQQLDGIAKDMLLFCAFLYIKGERVCFWDGMRESTLWSK